MPRLSSREISETLRIEEATIKLERENAKMAAATRLANAEAQYRELRNEKIKAELA